MSNEIITENRPKRGDNVSLSFTYAGMTSWELHDVERVRLNKVWIGAHGSPFHISIGRYTTDDFGAARKILFDNGKRAREYAKNGK
jgi:hypothetical protein